MRALSHGKETLCERFENIGEAGPRKGAFQPYVATDDELQKSATLAEITDNANRSVQAMIMASGLAGVIAPIAYCSSHTENLFLCAFFFALSKPWSTSITFSLSAVRGLLFRCGPLAVSRFIVSCLIRPAIQGHSLGTWFHVSNEI